MKLLDITGQRFGHLLVLERAESDNQNRVKWKCLCDCGNVTTVASYELRNGRTVSCGCHRAEKLRETASTHGWTKTRLYHIWLAMKARCFNQRATGFTNYGGRGITVCDEWMRDFVAFRDWALANGYRDDLSIDRVDNDGNYCPENCRWTNQTEQCRNRRSNIELEYKGETHPVVVWAESLGIKPATLYRRIRAGWSVERALATK